MKTISVLALILVACTAVTVEKENVVRDAEDFLEAFWPAAFDTALDLSTCEQDVSGTIKVIHDSLDLIQDKTKVSDYTKAIAHLVSNKQVFLDVAHDCAATVPEFAVGVNALRPLGAPGVATSAIAKATLRHPIDFPSNVVKAKSAFSKGDYANAGLYSGRDVHFILDQVKTAIEETGPGFTELEEFTDAFWLAAFDIELHLQDCTEKTPTAIKTIKTAISLIKDHSSVWQVTRSVLYIKNHFKDISIAFKSCTKAAPQLFKGVKMMTPFASVSTITSTSKAAMLHHPIAFPNNLRKGQAALRKGEYADAGRYLGNDFHYMRDELDKVSE